MRCFFFSAANKIQIGADVKKNLLDDIVKWMAKDCRPFAAISGTGFKSLAQAFIKIGAKYGENVDIDDLLPDETTVSRNLKSWADEKKTEFSSELKKAVEETSVAATTDLWTDNYVQRTFLGVTVHYVHNGKKITNRVLGIKSMDFERSTADNINIKLRSIFQAFGVDSLDKIMFVTDRGANICKALENEQRLNCSSHLFSNVLEAAFKETENLGPFINSCKKLVKYFKKANLQHMLETSLKSHCKTRWNTHSVMFKSIYDNFDQIKETLEHKDQIEKLQAINYSVLKNLVALCENFDIICKKLQGSNYVTLSFVLPSIQKLKSICEQQPDDLTIISSLKKNVIKQVDKTWIPNLTIVHKAAVFLYPPLNKHYADDVKQFCISKMILNYLPSTSVSPAEPSFSREHNFFFSNLISNSTPSAEAAEKEFERYKMTQINISEEFDPIIWWATHSNEFPKLSKLALRILSIPASSADSERIFSLAGNVVNEKRSRLLPKTIDSIIFLNSFLKNEILVS